MLCGEDGFFVFFEKTGELVELVFAVAERAGDAFAEGTLEGVIDLDSGRVNTDGIVLEGSDARIGLSPGEYTPAGIQPLRF